jgi:imidazolonepropionase-like amidohydrolase
VKFALGENVTRANFPEGRGRYPLSRMGVGEIMRDTFARAAELDRRKADFAAGRTAVPVRRDLRLEAAAEMLRGERIVHIHSYRQDEILMFVRLARELKLSVATFQHVLEGYKVAPEIASLGAGASMFTDWWAFKFEVYDAIPWNGVLMRDAGVIVSFNSDDPELARRLNTEAAKAVKYGGVPPSEALQFVTRNPAQQLRLDDRIGSLEPGKDADFVIWSGSPLSTLSRVEQTWIDGRRYFSLEDDAAMREADGKERAALIQRAVAVRQRALGSGGGGGEGEGGGDGDSRPAILRQIEALTAAHDHYRDLYHSGRGGDACGHEQANR